MWKKLVLIFFAFGFSGLSFSQTSCNSQEELIFSFHLKKSEKIMAICKEMNNSYLVYKFGTENKIELQFPSVLDENSWEKFEFSGLSRGGGKANIGFGEYSLSFLNEETEYSIFQEWGDEKNAYSIGINIQKENKSITIFGDKKTQKGSLVLLNNERKNIKNIQDNEDFP